MRSAFRVSKGLLCLYDRQNNTWLLLGMEFIFSCPTRHLTRSPRSLVSYLVKHSKRNSSSTPAHVLFSIYNMARAQEAGVAWGAAESNFHASLVLSKLSACILNSICDLYFCKFSIYKILIHWLCSYRQQKSFGQTANSACGKSSSCRFSTNTLK